jgi:hypothetical protein
MGEHAGMDTPDLIPRRMRALPALAALPALLGLVALALSACAMAADEGPKPRHLPAAAETRTDRIAAVNALIGDAECDHSDQCRAIAIGSKACGGPRSYLAWSVRNTDQAALQAAVDAQTQAEGAANRSGGLVSDCRMVTAPNVSCRPRASDGKKTCQLGQGGARGLD